MKLLVLLLVVLAGVWLCKRGRRPQPPRPGTRAALPMLRCRHCGMHVPGDEAVTSRDGVYCSAAHRRDAEGA